MIPEKWLLKQLQSAQKDRLMSCHSGVIGSAYRETQYDNLSQTHLHFSLQYSR